MEQIKKIIVLLGNILAFIGKLPAWMLPKSLKGYRTELFNILAVVVVMLESVDITGISEGLCQLFSCDADVIKTTFLSLVAAVNVALRRDTDTPPHSKG